VVTVFSFMLAGALLQGHRRGPLLGIVIVTVAYFAVADALYIWRLAAYIGLTEREPPAGQVSPVQPRPPQELFPENVIPKEGEGQGEVPQEKSDQPESDSANPPQSSESSAPDELKADS
jgi:hypothetical protein